MLQNFKLLYLNQNNNNSKKFIIQTIKQHSFIIQHTYIKMSFFTRMGTQKKKYKVEFFIGRLKFSSHFKGKVQIVIKRGDRKTKSQQKLEMTEDNKLNFNKQVLEMEVTMYFDQKQNKCQEKPGQLRVILFDEKNNKNLLGVVPFDVAQYANSGIQSKRQKKKLEQTPKKLEGLIQFDVFVKYIGEGSQSSLDKVSDFFFGKSKQQQQVNKNKKKVVETQQPNKKDKKKKQKDLSQQDEQAPSNKKSLNKNMTRTQVKDTRNGSKKQQKNQIKLGKNYVTTGKNKGSKANLTSDNDYNEEDQQDQGQNLQNKFYFDQPQINKKNEMISGKTNNKRSNSAQKSSKKMGEIEISNSKNKSKKNNKDNQQQGSEGSQGSHGEEQQNDMQTSDVQPVQPINTANMFKRQKQTPYPNQQPKQPESKSKSSKSPFQQQQYQKYEQKPMNKQKSAKHSQNNSTPYQQTKRNPSEQRPSNKSYQTLIQQNQSLKSRLQQAQLTIKSLKKQISQATTRLQQSQQQINYYQKQLRLKQQELQKQRDTISNIQHNIAKQSVQKGSLEYFQQQVKKLQREKNQLIVEKSKINQKHKAEIKRYEQAISEFKQRQNDINQASRAEIQRIKDQFSLTRERLQKTNKQKDDKASQCMKIKSENKNLQVQITDLKSSLSKLKLKICNLLNDALAKNQDSTIDMLMDLNKD